MKNYMVTMNLLLAVLFAVSAFSAEPVTIPLYKDGIKDNPFKPANKEKTVNRKADQNEKGLNRAIYNVTEPVLDIYLAPDTGAKNPAVVVFPGGGFTHVTIDKEGYDVAEWLNSIGVSAIVVTYRTVPEELERGSKLSNKLRKVILEDAVQAVSVTRSKSLEWNLDSEKIGVMGFSAGGNLSGSIITQMYVPDGVDFKTEIRPDFACLVYPGIGEAHNAKVDSTLPPVFITVAMDDHTTPAPRAISFFEKLLENSVLTELHIFQSGSHGFGLAKNKSVAKNWPFLFENWLKENGILSK